MSHRYDLHCRTCGEDAGFSWNHGDRELTALWRRRHAWAALLPAVAEAFPYSARDAISLHFLGPESGGRDFHEWAAKHLEHDVAVQDEYGAFVDRCGEPFDCGECGTKHVCGLDAGHPPPHRRRT